MLCLRVVITKAQTYGPGHSIQMFKSQVWWPLGHPGITENTNLRVTITVWLTSCLFCLDLSALLMSTKHQFFLFGQIQTSQTGGQLYNDTSSRLYVASHMTSSKQLYYITLKIVIAPTPFFIKIFGKILITLKWYRSTNARMEKVIVTYL